MDLKQNGIVGWINLAFEKEQVAGCCEDSYEP